MINLQAFGCFGEVSIPASRLSFGMVLNDAGKVNLLGEYEGVYKVPSGAFEDDAELYQTAENRGHTITGFISTIGGTFYTID